MSFKRLRAYTYGAAFALLLSLTLSLAAFGAEAPSIPPGEKQQLDSSTRESGERITDRHTRNETLNEIRATPTTPPPAVGAPSAPPSAPSSGPLPPLSTGGKF